MKIKNLLFYIYAAVCGVVSSLLTVIALPNPGDYYQVYVPPTPELEIFRFIFTFGTFTLLIGIPLVANWFYLKKKGESK